MRKVFLPAALACALVVVSALAQNKQSLVGTWKIDIAQSDFGSDPTPKSATLIILKDTPKMASYRLVIVDDKGKSSAYSWSGPQDGSTHPFMENGKNVSKESQKRAEDGSLLIHSEDPDGTLNDVRSRVSDDGNTITDEATMRSKDGKETKQKWIYRRVSEKKGGGAA